MTFEEYRFVCLRTWNTKPTKEMQIANAALGLVGETGEWIRDGVLSEGEELGDIWYYVAVLSHLLDVTSGPPSSFYERPTTDLLFRLLVFHRKAADVAEAVKKHVFHGKPTDRAKQKVEVFYRFLLRHTADPAVTWQQNVDKLKTRHPDGWSTEYTTEEKLRAFAARESQ